MKTIHPTIKPQICLGFNDPLPSSKTYTYSFQNFIIYKISNIRIATMLIPYPWWQYHGYLGLGLVLHIRGQYEKPWRIGKELLPCKKQLKTSTIGKTNDHDKGTNIRKVLKIKFKNQANLLTIQVPSKTFWRCGIKVLQINNKAPLLSS